MTIIKIAPNDNGGHSNQTIYGVTSESFHAPNGWAVVPDDMLPLENFPFGKVTVSDVGGVPIVTGWTPLPMPEPEEEPEAPPTLEEQNRADIDYLAALTGVEL